MRVENCKLGTQCIQGGWDPKKGEARVLPIYQSTTFKYDTCDYMGKLFGKQGRLLGRSPKSAVSVIAGLLLGFPVGTRMLAGLYDRGEIDKDELERTIGVCGIPSFGFLSGVLGSKAFSSRRFGIFMYFAAILAALTVFAKLE